LDLISVTSQKHWVWERSTKLAEKRNRKPMVLMGARQVGKTWLVRDLAKRRRLKLIELNFERLPNLADLFSENMRKNQSLIQLEKHDTLPNWNYSLSPTKM
jgi:predicted AAA+ superfamily ATPase